VNQPLQPGRAPNVYDDALSDAGAIEPLVAEPAPRPPPSRPVGVTPDGRLISGKLAGLTMNRAIWTLSWPILAESFLNSLVGLTDTVLSAGIDDGGVSTDVVGGAVYVLWFMGLVVQAIGVGATTLISRAVGGGRLGVARAAVGQTMILAVAGGVATGGLMALAAGPAAAVLSLKPDAAAIFREFMLISSCGVPFAAVLFAGIACVRGAGDSLRPLWAMLLVNAVNAAASWTLAGVDLKTTSVVGGEVVSRVLLHNPFGFDMGVRGIALGTLAAHVAGAVFMTLLLTRGVAGVRLTAFWLRPHRHTLARLARVGIPNFLETLGMWAGNFLIVLMVGWMGREQGGPLGSHLVAIRTEAFSYLPGFAFGAAAATLVGQYLGAGSVALARRSVLICTAASAAFMGAMGLVFIFWGRGIVGLLSSQEVHLTLVPPLLFITGLVQIPFAVSIVLRSALRGAGDARATMWLTWVTTYALRLPMAYGLSGVDVPLPGGGVFENPFGEGWGLRGLWMGLCGEIVIRAVLFSVRFGRGAWERARV